MKTIKTLRTTWVVALTLSATIGFAQKKTQSFSVSRIIEAPADQVWAVVGEDFGAIANSHPKIVNSDYIGGTLHSGEGAERVCNLNDKGTKYTHEKQVNFDPENYSFTAQVFHAEGLPLDTEYSFATYKVEPIDEKSSRLIFEMTYRTSPAFMGSLAKSSFKKTISDYTLAVQHHVLTGEKVTKDNFKEIKKRYKG